MENTLQAEWTRRGSVANGNCGRRTGQEAPSSFSTCKPGQVMRCNGKGKGNSPKPESASCNSIHSGSTAGRDAELTTPWAGFCFLSREPAFPSSLLLSRREAAGITFACPPPGHLQKSRSRAASHSCTGALPVVPGSASLAVGFKCQLSC